MNKKIGYFNSNDKKIDFIKYANWGSRPFEYYWVIDTINKLNIPNIKVIDLGIGEPSLHGWPNFFRYNFKYDLYVGIDRSSLLDIEKIDENNFKLQRMDMTKIDYPDKKFNLGLCISTFEHLDSLESLFQSFTEIYRVLEDNSYLIVTLDEIWDCNKEFKQDTFWSNLDFSLRNENYNFIDGISFSIFDFIEIIKPFFIPVETINEKKKNKDETILHNVYYNDAVSYCLLKKV